MKCFIIRLKENRHSCDIAKECFDAAESHGLAPEYFDAIDGNDADRHYEDTGITRVKKFKKGRPGVMGCFFSHYYLWKKCVELDEPIIVLEHDGYVIKPVPESIVNTFDDILKLDNCDPFSPEYNQDLDQVDSDIVEVVKYYNDKAKEIVVNEIDALGTYFRGAYSYIIKPEGAKKLIDFVEEYGHLPADQQINQSILDLKVTSTTLARLHPLYSVGNNIKELSLTRKI